MATPKTESRSFQMRAAEGDSYKLEGYAATFGTRSDPIGGQFYEIIAPGAFTDALAGDPDIHATVQHNFGALLGRTKNGSLTLKQDDKGLWFSIQLDENSVLHREVYNNVRSGLLSECSFSFNDCVDTWEPATKEFPLPTRTITRCAVFEVAAVAKPAYSQTSVDARALAATTDTATLLAKIKDLPLLWKQQERAHELGLEIARSAHTPEQRAADDNDEPSDEDYADAQQALIDKYGRSANGHAPAHWLISMDSQRCRTLHMDSQVRCSVPYSRDDEDEFDFGDVNPDTDYCEPDDRSRARLAEARQILSDSDLRTRMEIAAGRGRR